MKIDRFTDSEREESTGKRKQNKSVIQSQSILFCHLHRPQISNDMNRNSLSIQPKERERELVINRFIPRLASWFPFSSISSSLDSLGATLRSNESPSSTHLLDNRSTSTEHDQPLLDLNSVVKQTVIDFTTERGSVSSLVDAHAQSVLAPAVCLQESEWVSFGSPQLRRTRCSAQPSNTTDYLQNARFPYEGEAT